MDWVRIVGFSFNGGKWKKSARVVLNVVFPQRLERLEASRLIAFNGLFFMRIYSTIEKKLGYF